MKHVCALQLLESVHAADIVHGGAHLGNWLKQGDRLCLTDWAASRATTALPQEKVELLRASDWAAAGLAP